MTNCMSLAEALDLLGPIRAWAATDKQTGEPVFWLDGKKVTEGMLKREAHRVFVDRNTRSY